MNDKFKVQLVLKDAIINGHPYKITSLEDFKDLKKKNGEHNFLNIMSYQTDINDYIVGDLYEDKETNEIYVFSFITRGDGISNIGFFNFESLKQLYEVIFEKEISKNNFLNIVLTKFAPFHTVNELNLKLIGNTLIREDIVGVLYDGKLKPINKNQSFVKHLKDMNNIKIKDLLSKSFYCFHINMLSPGYTLQENCAYNCLFAIYESILNGDDMNINLLLAYDNTIYKNTNENTLVNMYFPFFNDKISTPDIVIKKSKDTDYPITHIIKHKESYKEFYKNQKDYHKMFLQVIN